MALRKQRGGHSGKGIFVASLLLCVALSKVPSFVAPRNTQQRAKRVVVHMHSGDDEVPPDKMAVLLAIRAQAKVVKAELEMIKQEAGTVKAKLEMLQQEALKQEAGTAEANLEMLKQEASGVRSQAAASPPKLEGSNPSGRLEDVKMNYSGTVMTQAEWEDLSEKIKALGPQGRRKLKALREGKTGRAFILPGERVRLLQEEKAFRAAFKRFPAQSLNGYSAEKWAKRGQECIIEKTFNDKTITCVFADNSRLDFPWEIVDGYVDD